MWLKALFNLIAVFVLLESAFHFGLVPNEKHRLMQSLKSEKGSPRILILGDSFSAEYDGTMSKLLKEELKSRGAAVLNLAAPGFGPQDYLDKLKAYAGSFSPQLVLLNYYVGNDLTDTLYKGGHHSAALHFLKQGLRKSFLISHLLDLRAQRIARQRLNAVENKIQGVSPFLVEIAKAHPNYVIENLLLETPEALRAWEKNVKILDEIVQLSDAQGSKLLLNIFPSTAQVSSQHFQFYAKVGLKTDPKTLADSRPQQMLGAYCEKRKLQCLDLLPEFRKRGQSTPLYLELDDHWNTMGNHLAFELIRARLKQSGF